MLSRRRAKTNHDLADSSGFTISKGIKSKLLKDPTTQDARHLKLHQVNPRKSVPLKIRSYITQRKCNCKLTEML